MEPTLGVRPGPCTIHLVLNLNELEEEGDDDKGGLRNAVSDCHKVALVA